MAVTSKCPKCDRSSFELAEAKIKGANIKHWFVQCAGCGAVVAALDFRSTNSVLDGIEKKLDKIASDIANLPRR